MVITKQIFTLVLLLSLSCAEAAMIGLRSPEFLASMNRLPPAASSFNPDSVAGLYMRFEASDLALNDGDSVATWTDTKNGYDLKQATAGKRPIWTNNVSVRSNDPWLVFDATDDFLTNRMAVEALQPMTIFLLGYHFDASANYTFFGSTNETTTGVCQMYNSTVLRVGAGGAINIGIPGTNMVLFEVTLNGASGSVITNGVSVGNFNFGTNSLGQVLTLNSRSPSGALYGKLNIAALLIYTASVSAGDRTNIRQWFRDTHYAY